MAELGRTWHHQIQADPSMQAILVVACLVILFAEVTMSCEIISASLGPKVDTRF